MLADRVLPGTLPDNCRSLSFASRTKAGRGLRFEAALTKELRPKPVAIVAHMCPIYAVLAAPLARPLGVPLLLWFTHWKRTRTLEAAEKASTAVVSVDRRSFPIDSPKVVAIGHGIDLDEFPCRPEGQRANDFRVASLGRYSRAKGLETVVRAIALLDGVRLEAFGPALSAAEREHKAELARLVGELGLDSRVRLDAAVLRSEVPEILGRADCLVNNMEAGAPDKVVYEAGASCVPVIASNPVFDELLDGLLVPLQFPRDDPDAAGGSHRAAGDDDPGAARLDRPRAARAGGGRPLRAALGRAYPRGGPAMSTNGAKILHFQKVAGISGSEAHLLSLLPRLAERGWDVRMLMLHEHEPGAWDFARELEARGVPLDAIPIARDFDPAAFMRLVNYVGRERPTILHTHLVHADAYGQIAGALAGVPVRVSTKHGFNEFREGRAFALADRGVASLAHVHIAISRGLAQYLEQAEGFDAEDFEIVHYGIAPRGEPSPYAESSPRLLCVGRLIPIKGHIVLLRAFAEARREVPGLTLDIAGRGPLEPALKALARELEVDDAVRFLGYVSPIQDAIERSAVIVVPSMGEGFGMVALEAMERARPVIAAAIGGLGELVADGETGVLVAPGEAQPLARAIVELAGDLERAARMGEAGRRRALTEFLEERCIERTEQLYERALS